MVCTTNYINILDIYVFIIFAHKFPFTANYTMGCHDKENAFHMTVLSYVIYQFGPALESKISKAT